MSSPPALSGLDTTTVARWRSRLIGQRPDEKSHWRTKTAYYRAAIELLATVAPRVLSWQMIVSAVRPKGSRSTFYDVAGPHAKHPLIKDFLAGGDDNATQLVLCYRRQSAIEQLIDEAKVWSFWPYRQGWLDQHAADPERGGSAMAESLLSVVAAWARREAPLAAALDHAPPVCAVEDLVLVRRGQVSATRAFSLLADAISAAGGTAAEIASGLPGGARIDLATTGGPGTADAVLDRLAEQIYAMTREAHRVTPTQTSVRELAAALMRDAAWMLV